jgi:hypothetical protein
MEVFSIFGLILDQSCEDVHKIRYLMQAKFLIFSGYRNRIRIGIKLYRSATLLVQAVAKLLFYN